MNQISFLDQAHIFLQQANDELARGDLRQASEKAWGAAAQAVKAAGEAHGWEHDSHSKLFVIARRLSEESSDATLLTQFNRAGDLHRNFYEGHMSGRRISRNVREVTALVRSIGEILSRV